MILGCIALAGAHAQINRALVGSWDWVEGHMPGVPALHAGGNYLWAGVDCGFWQRSARAQGAQS